MATVPIPKRRRRSLPRRVASPSQGFRHSRNSLLLRPHPLPSIGGMNHLPPSCADPGARRLWHSVLLFALSSRFSSLQTIAETLLYMDLGLI
uniref:Uncharacterized protein n=1 Tax=Zea mays TaxID=4577 RepID=B6SH33_MAIZE|nr:hypothetical protein [Zea mays]